MKNKEVGGVGGHGMERKKKMLSTRDCSFMNVFLSMFCHP